MNTSKTRNRTLHRLSARQVEAVTDPCILMDGGGLLLRVSEHGHKKWLLRYVSPLTGKRREMGLGRADKGFVSLKTARDAAQAARELIARKLDPIEEAKNEKAARLAAARKGPSKTFGQFADEWLDKNEGTFRNVKHRAQWRMTLARYAAPLRNKTPGQITTEDVLTTLQSIWQSKPETAKRTQGRIERVMDAARAVGLYDGNNPARWRGHLDKLLPGRRKFLRTHHAALPHADLPAFMRALRGENSIGARALEFLILTTARSGEVRGMTWGELDIQSRRWTVPAQRMKAGKGHRVPLTTRCMEIIAEMTALRSETDNEQSLVFPGAKDGRPMSDMTLSAVLKRMKRTDITVHGFRSTFRDWAEDVARYPYGAIKAALAHTIADHTDAAYRRGDAYQIRVELMEAWKAYAYSSTERCKVVIQLRQVS